MKLQADHLALNQEQTRVGTADHEVDRGVSPFESVALLLQVFHSPEDRCAPLFPLRRLLPWGEWFINSQTRPLHASEEKETRRQGSKSP